MPNDIASDDEPGRGPTLPPSPELPEFAKKAEDLQALRDAVVDAATVSGGLWLSFLFVFFYLAIAAGGVTHRDLFFEHAVKLPFLNVDLPLLGFFILGPILFLIVHVYTLLHFSFLSGKINAFSSELQRQIEKGNAETGDRLRRQLPTNIFVQFLAGPKEARTGATGILLRLIAWISLVFGPVLLLVFFQLQFLPFHAEWISWLQRTIIVTDLVLLWFLWPSVARSEVASVGSPSFIRRTLTGLLALATVLAIVIEFVVATFPSESLEGIEESYSPAPLIAPVGWARTMLVSGAVNEVSQRPTSLWSNRLVLPGINIVNDAHIDAGRNTSTSSGTASLRGRHLEGAVLIGANLSGADLTGAHLAQASLTGVDFRDAKFCTSARDQCTDLSGAELTHAQLQGADLGRVRLRGTILNDADLDGANLAAAELQGAQIGTARLERANLAGAHLENASLVGAQLQGATLNGAHLEGAYLDANLQGVTLNQAHLEGATLDRAKLHGAVGDLAQLQGASLHEAELMGATLVQANLAGADLRAAQLHGAVLVSAQLQGTLLSEAQLQGADLSRAQLQDASIDNVFVWLSETQDLDAKGAQISKLNTMSAYFGLGTLGRQCSTGLPCPWNAEAFERLRRIIDSGVPDGPNKERALSNIDRLNPAKQLSWRSDFWDLLQHYSPEPGDYDKALALRLQQIGCAAQGAPYVIHGFVKSSFDKRFASDPAQAALVAGAFLDQKCQGARGLPEEDKAVLEKISAGTGLAKH